MTRPAISASKSDPQVSTTVVSAAAEIGNLVASPVSGEQKGDTARRTRPVVYASVDAATFNLGI